MLPLIHCTAGISVIWLHTGTLYASGGMHSPDCQWRDPSYSYSFSFHDSHVWENMSLDRGKSASPIFRFCCVTWVSACHLARFCKTPAVPAGKLIGLIALSRGNSQKRIYFRMTQITSSSKQLFTNYSTGSRISGCLNRRKCVYSVFPTEIKRKKCWWNGCLTPGTCCPLPKGATVHVRHGWGKASWLMSASVCIHSGWNKGCGTNTE